MDKIWYFVLEKMFTLFAAWKEDWSENEFGSIEQKRKIEDKYQFFLQILKMISDFLLGEVWNLLKMKAFLIEICHKRKSIFAP